MTYRAFYRQWRPMVFNEIVGQDHVARTLKNAIKTSRVAHAYLFCGPRGTGKTSTAKIFSKALNCQDIKGGEPCNSCINCTAINEGSLVDVIEIDAASNRGIEEIRDLREKVKYAPTSGRYKVYIIDEVHMLTNEAFNALLKTLEEPPSHVVFILATTEPHKLPLTILSRCQRFDFRMIQPPDIIGRLKEVVAAEEIIIGSDALSLIARAAGGSLRDALSTLDQCAAFSGKEITIDDLHDILGTVQEELMERLARYLHRGEIPPVLRIVDELTGAGKDLRLFAGEFASYLRLIMLAKVAPGDKDILPPGYNIECIQKLAELFSVERLLGIIDLICQAEQEMKWSGRQRLVFEVALIKTVYTKGQNATLDASDLEMRLSALEETLGKLRQDKAVSSQSARPARVEKALNQLKESRDSTVYPVKSGKAKEPNEVKIPDEAKVYPQPDSATSELEQLKAAWPTLLEKVKKVSRTAHGGLRDGKPLDVSKKTVKIGFGNPFLIQVVEGDSNCNVIEKALGELFKRKIKIHCVEIPTGARTTQGEKKATPTKTGKKNNNGSVNVSQAKQENSSSVNKKTITDKLALNENNKTPGGLVSQAIKMFNGTEITDSKRKGEVFFRDEG